MKSTIKQLTPVETFKPITLEIQIETLEELRILRGLWGANYSIGNVVTTEASYMEGISDTQVAHLLTKAFAPLERHYESLRNGS